MIEKININDLINREADTMAWLYDNPHADIRLFESNARLLNILRIRINNYNNNNKL